MGQEHTLQELRRLGGSTEYTKLETAIGNHPQTIKKTLLHLQRQGIIKIEKHRTTQRGRPTWKGAKITIKGEQ
jgi:transcription initiation factor IIE alpha subunit